VSPNAPSPTIRRSLAWVGFGQVSYFALTFLGSVAVARLLSPHDTGIFAIASAVVGLLAIIQAMGLGNFLIREPELSPGLIGTVFTVNALASLMLSILVALVGLLGGAFFGDAGVRDVLLVLASVPLIGQLAFLPNALLEREGQFRTLTLIRTLSTATGLVLTVGLALSGFRYMSLAYSQVATALLTNLTVMVVARRHVSFRLSLEHWADVSRFGAQIFAVSGITRMAQRLSDIALGKLIGLSALGLYTRASGNYNMLWDNIHTIATRVLFVDFANRQRDGLPLRDRYLQVVAVITTLLWPAFLGLAILAGPLVRLVYGERWDGAAAPLSLLCLAGVLLTSITMTWEVFVVTGETQRQARLEVIRTVVGFALFVAGCLHSLAAAAAARVGDALVAQWLYRPHLHRLTDTTPAELLRIYRVSALTSLPAILPAGAVMALWRWSPAVPLPAVLGAIVAGALGWIAALRVSNHLLWQELVRLRNGRRREEA
jgi:O-antigen/teichoic acid export membrane protein